MDLIINSLYSDKDIFLRELVSNAADACDKKRFLSLTDSSPTSEDQYANLGIRIKADPDANTITIEDAGVGMTRDELINNLGKIAQSGTKKFVEALGESGGAGDDDVNLIGQFGVGFYSAYLVADKVEVVTQSMQAGSPQLRWTSSADSSYTIEEDASEPLPGGSGTRLILHMKEDAADYLESGNLDELLNRYSEFIEFPISIWKEKTEYKTVPDDEANKDLKEGEEPKTKTVPETTQAYERVNNQKPIWLRSPRQVTEEEYSEFYKSTFKGGYDVPIRHSHFVLEGQVECKALLYIPGMLPFELSKDMFDENSRNLRLYVKRVFINDKFEELMPRWLKFVRGVVDSDDLPLNVSREILQKSKVLSIINKRLVRKSLDMIRDIAESDEAATKALAAAGDDEKSEEDDDKDINTEDAGKYVLFWNNFGKYLKVGIIEDDVNRKDIAPLLRFYSSQSGEEYTSLDKYIENMPEKQKSIYYVTGSGREATAMSPVIEKFQSRGYDVLFATEPLDEIMLESLKSYKELDILDAAKENVNLADEEDDDEDSKAKKEEEKEARQKEFSKVTEYLETLLKDKVKKVVVSDDLTSSPAVLVQGAYGMSPTMQRYMTAQAVASGGEGAAAGFNQMNQAVLEINPDHTIVKDLQRMILAGEQDKPECQDFATLLHDVASLTSGYEVSDLRGFAKRVLQLMDDKVTSSDATVESKTTEDSGDSNDEGDDSVAKDVEVVA